MIILSQSMKFKVKTRQNGFLRTIICVLCYILLFYMCATGPGMFILNLVCRNVALREGVLERVNALFPTIFLKKIDEDVNEVLLCSRKEKSPGAICNLPSLNQAARSLQNKLRFHGSGTGSPHIDIVESLKDLKLL